MVRFMTTATDPWAALRGEKYISLETFKRSGEGVKTPIWFVRDGDSLVFMTSAKAWKVKRLRRNPACRLAACNVTGSRIKGAWLDGACARVDSPEAVAAGYRLLARKYLSLRLANPFAKLLGRVEERVYYRITPA
jgi:PPOX class probable F420-dependent enzyme